MISTPFLCSLFPALTSLGCLLLVVICCVISRALPEGRGILANDHCSCSCKTLGSSGNLGFTANSTHVCKEGLLVALGTLGYSMGAHGCTAPVLCLYPTSMLSFPPWCVGSGALGCPSWFMHRGSHDPQELLYSHQVTPMFQPSEVTSVHGHVTLCR